MRTKMLLIGFLCLSTAGFTQDFNGKYFRGKGDAAYFDLLEKSIRFFNPDPALPNLSMLYSSSYNSLVEGPTWDAWWIQNSYGTTYAALPYLQEPYLTFLQHAQDFWFDMMGDGKRIGYHNWQAPDGALCDCARPGWVIYKQGDGNYKIHDWAIGFTTAGILMQSELLLISRDQTAINHYLPLLERSANFVDSRRDPKNNLYLAGPAANLLAPSFAGWKKPDGTYGQAYLAEISITFIAALDRLIELEKLAGRTDQANHYITIRNLARKGLPLLLTKDGYFVRSIDPDGTIHGIYGAAQHGYFEVTPNQDAMAFRVADDRQSKKIFSKIASIPELRPYSLILPNFPAYDDMYNEQTGIWQYGTWVNGGHWSTCEGRMMMAYARLGQYEDIRKSMEKMMTYANQFRMDNPLTERGNAVYQPKQPFNITYDAFAIPAAMVRGLFEYVYQSDKLTLIPHIPSGISEIEQQIPIRFGTKKLWLSAKGTGAISSVIINGNKWKSFDKTSVSLQYDQLPDMAAVYILMGTAKADRLPVPPPTRKLSITADDLRSVKDTAAGFAELKNRILHQYAFYNQLDNNGMGSTYEAAHARLAVEAFAAACQRKAMIQQGKLALLPVASQQAVDLLYLKTADALCTGIEQTMEMEKKKDINQSNKAVSLYQSTLKQ